MQPSCCWFNQCVQESMPFFKSWSVMQGRRGEVGSVHFMPGSKLGSGLVVELFRFVMFNCTSHQFRSLLEYWFPHVCHQGQQYHMSWYYRFVHLCWHQVGPSFTTVLLSKIGISWTAKWWRSETDFLLKKQLIFHKTHEDNVGGIAAMTLIACNIIQILY